jgi:hypothetical protein
MKGIRRKEGLRVDKINNFPVIFNRPFPLV